MNGSVSKDRKRGTWYYVIDVPGADGKRRQERKRGFAKRDDALEGLDRRRTELRAGHVPVPDDESVAAFAKAWIAALPAEGLEPGTVRFYSGCVTRLLPSIGDTKLQELTALDLDRAYAALLTAGLAPSTVRSSHVSVKKMLGEALRLRIVGRNVADDARPPHARAARAKQFATWTYPELLKFLDAVRDDEHGALCHVASLTGMRRGELVALKWADVDFDAAAITVCRSVGRGLDGVHEKAPKSDAGRRVVELDVALVDVLKRHRQAQRERRLLLGAGWRDHGLVFTQVDGEPIHPDRLSERWTLLVRRVAPPLGLATIRLHDLRHSHATQLLAADVRPDVVSARLGHSSVAFTLQQYGHRYAGDQRSGLARLRKMSRDHAVTTEPAGHLSHTS